MNDFEQAFEHLIGHEGGYQNDYADRGNWTTGIIGHGERKGTKFGISAMTYPHLDIKNIRLDDAKDIYMRDWWQGMSLNDLPTDIRFQMFDAAVNSGRGNAVRWLQRAARVADDGIIGPITLAAAAEIDPEALVARFNGERLLQLTKLSIWRKYGRGWARRIAANLNQAD